MKTIAFAVMAAMTAVFGFAGDGEAVKAGGTDPVKTISALTGVDVATEPVGRKPVVKQK